MKNNRQSFIERIEYFYADIVIAIMLFGGLAMAIVRGVVELVQFIF